MKGTGVLYRFEIENFFSIRDRQVIDLRVAKNTPNAPDRLVPLYEGASERIPLVVAFFGSNGAGKSNVLKALNFVFAFVGKSFQFKVDESFEFFRFSDAESQNRPASFVLEFTYPEPAAIGEPGAVSDCHYRYSLEIDAVYPPVVKSEALSFRRANARRFARLFSREYQHVISGRELAVGTLEGNVGDILRPNASVISTLAQFNNKIATAFVHTANIVSSNIGIYKHEGNDDQMMRFYQQPEVLEAFNRDVSRLDIGIKRLNLSLTPGGLIAAFDHEGLIVPIPLIFESHGTRQFFRIFPYLEYALRIGNLAIVDELDASLHPTLLPEILNWFISKSQNSRRSQLWMTCQASSLLEDLIKSEIFFCEKDQLGRTTVFGLKDIHGVKNADDFQRRYLGGIYGAIPNVG